VGGLSAFSAMATGGVGGFVEEPGGSFDVVDGGGSDEGMSWGGGGGGVGEFWFGGGRQQRDSSTNRRGRTLLCCRRFSGSNGNRVAEERAGDINWAVESLRHHLRIAQLGRPERLSR
jgi:hypothetical protein